MIDLGFEEDIRTIFSYFKVSTTWLKWKMLNVIYYHLIIVSASDPAV